MVENATRPSNRQRSPKPLPKNRLEAISDGVFSVALTLLIVDLATHIPRMETTWWPGFWPKLVLFVYSFWVVGIFWIAHHNELNMLTQLGSAERPDTRMREFLYINLLFLLFIVCVPFSAALLSENWDLAARMHLPGADASEFHRGSWLARTPFLVYAGNLLLAACALQWLWRYIRTGRAGDVDEEHRDRFDETSWKNSVIPSAVVIVVLSGLLVPTIYAQWALALVPPAYMIGTLFVARHWRIRRLSARAEATAAPRAPR